MSGLSLSDEDWQILIEEYDTDHDGKISFDEFKKIISPNFKDLILHTEVRTPRELEAEVGLTEGNIFQGELTLDQLMFMRPVAGHGRYRSPIAGLYLCGAGAHPGGGVTGAPGYNAAWTVLNDRKG